MAQRSFTLLRRGNRLADPTVQQRILHESSAAIGAAAEFEARAAASVGEPLTAARIEVLQVNVGRLCNQTCRHCHVDAGPDRRENMSREIAEICLDVLARHPIATLDITGGAPELNPNFRWMVTEAYRLRRAVIDRCNLTILLSAGFDDLPSFFADHNVEIIASLPCYLEQNCDAQRGEGVFFQSIEAIRRLNRVGYGRSDSTLKLSLVYNPLGPSLPPPQAELEATYRRELKARYDIEFTRLYTIANMPISRFLDDLLETGRLDEYLRRLVESFNPANVSGLMCRNTISVDWRGFLFDCDFNQMLDLPVARSQPRHIRDFAMGGLSTREIVTGPHCFGCTAGFGSSCQGAIRDGQTV